MSKVRPFAQTMRQMYASTTRKCAPANPSQRQILHIQPIRPPTRPSQHALPKTHHRPASTRSGPYSFRTLMRQYPISFPFAIAGAVLSAAGFAYASYLYYRMYRLMGPYPENVGLKLRRAIYFTDINEDFARAVKAYMQALQLAAQEGMPALSDEVIGIKVALVRCLEKNGAASNAVEICEQLKGECVEWVGAHGGEEGMARERNRLLGWGCKIGTVLADLYADPRVADAGKSEENLVWAVETNVRERQRREREGVKEGEGPWLDNDELGSQLEALAHKYESQSKHFFAAQLFLQALSLKPTTDCHTVILMSNLAASLAQQTPPPSPNTPPPSRAELRESGRAWVRQALALSRNIKPPERTPECDHGCVAATHNLGEFAEMDGNVAEARRRYEEAGSLAHAVGFEEGVQAAEEGLRRLEGGSGKERRTVRNKATKGWW